MTGRVFLEGGRLSKPRPHLRLTVSNFFDFRNFGKIPLKIWEISKFPYSRKNFTGTPKNFRYTRGNFRYTRGNFHVTDIENQTTN